MVRSSSIYKPYSDSIDHFKDNLDFILTAKKQKNLKNQTFKYIVYYIIFIKYTIV